MLVPPVLTPIGAWNYRARAQLKLEARGREVILGFYRSRSHRVVEVLECPLLLPFMNQVLSYLRSWIAKDKGLKESLSLIREVHFMAGTGEDGVLLSFIGPRIDARMVEAIGKGLRAGFPLLRGIAFQGTKGGTLVWGQGSITARVFDLSLRISAGSFFQVNEKGAEALVKKVLEYAELNGKEAVLDLYSGVGTFTLPLAQRSRRVVGVELDMHAIVDALYNLEKNRIENCEILNMATEEALGSHILRERWDVVVLDPPRLGLTRQALQGLLRICAHKIIYVSCDPSTLARDIFRLSQHGYRCLEVQPLDLYPQTYHIEAVALLEKRGIKVQVDGLSYKNPKF